VFIAFAGVSQQVACSNIPKNKTFKKKSWQSMSKMFYKKYETKIDREVIRKEIVGQLVDSG
jgi:hypothetical protein